MNERAQIWVEREWADRLYEALCAQFCWHCGVTTERNYRVANLLDEYRQMLIEDGGR